MPKSFFYVFNFMGQCLSGPRFVSRATTQTASFSRITNAKKLASQTEADIRAGRHFKTVEAKKYTAADLIDRYIRHELPKKGSQASNQKTQLLWCHEAIGPLYVAVYEGFETKFAA